MAPARVTVAVDFGTTFSGFAYARTSQPDDVFKLYEWPGAGSAGAMPYCKNQTSLFYAPSPSASESSNAPLQLKDWGWSSLLSYTEALRSTDAASHISDFMSFLPANLAASFGQLSARDHPEGRLRGKSDELALPPELAQKVGYFATKFKLFLAPNAPAPRLPGGLTVEQLFVDYLRCLSSFIMSELRVNYGKHFGMNDVQWCLTVPAIWEEKAKQAMKTYAEKAGLVQGPSSPPSASGSPFPLDIILEPEAASVYCQIKSKDLNLKKGDKLLVADVGGGTIDLVVHEKADEDPASLKVHEVVSSYGDLGGGTFVDANFFAYLCKKIGCFRQFSRTNKSVVLEIYRRWQQIKTGFDGEGFSAELALPTKLRKAWAKYDQSSGAVSQDEDYYDELRLQGKEIKAMFDIEVKKVIRLINRQIRGARVLMVVGGFSASPYLRECIKKAMANKVEAIIIPEDPGSAICHGAVQLHLKRGVIQSRISKRTYGVLCSPNAEADDPSDLLFTDDDGVLRCRGRIDVFVKAGDRVPLNASIARSYSPTYHSEKRIQFKLVSSLSEHPKYMNEPGVVEDGTFIVDVSQDMRLDKDRSVMVTMVFGTSNISVSAERANFGKPGKEKTLSVFFQQG